MSRRKWMKRWLEWGWLVMTASAWGAPPPMHILTFQVSSNVAAGSALHVTGDRPELGAMSTVGAIRMYTSAANQWTARVAVAGSTVSTSVTYRFMARTTTSGTHCNAGNGNLSGTAYVTNLPLWNPGYAGKTIYYHSTWSNVVVWHRVGDTDTWAASAVMERIGAGRNASEHRYRVSGVGEAGRPLEFVMRGVLNGAEQWDNPAVGGVGGFPGNYSTSLDAFFLQDKNIFNYIPPATVSAPQVISVASWPSSYTANGIPSRGGRIYLPRGYTQNTTKRYPVLYMHDGQNVFDPGGDFGSWSADAAATREITHGRMRETVIVAVNNTGSRMSEYGTPQDGDPPYTGDYYLKYLVNNVKPTIDANYRTLTNFMNTGNMGSSLGGLISAYIGLSSNVFGLVGAVSPSYWYGPNFRNWINSQPTKGNRIYQDAGTAEGSSMWDHFWPVYTYYLQDGYVVNDDLKAVIGCGDGHNEAAWAGRVAGAFQFLYNPRDETNLLETNTLSAGTVQFTAAAVDVSESAGTLQVQITRTGGSNGTASVQYFTSNGTATAGADYGSMSGTLAWADLDATPRTVDIPILEDGLHEGPETFTVRLANATGAALGSPAILTVTILDNDPAPAQLVITHPPTDITVGEEVNAYDLQGLAVAAAWQGLVWTNSLTGQSGPAPIADSWQIAGISLGHGENVITVTATNPVLAAVTNARDSAADAAYASGWTQGANGGLGFGPWTLYATDSGGYFVGGNGWGLWSQSNHLAEAIRPFEAPLAVGQRFHAIFQNKWIMEGQQGVGMALRNSAGDSLIQFYFNGGDMEYQVEDAGGGRDSGIGWTDAPQAIEIEVLSSTDYVLRIGAATVAGTWSGQIEQVRFWNWSGGTGSDYDFFFDDLQITALESTSVSTNAMVVITRESPVLHEGIPLAWWNRYGLGTSSSAAEDIDDDGASNWDEYIADTDPTNRDSVFPNRVVATLGAELLLLQAGPPTTNSRVYDAWFTTDLLADDWHPSGLDVPGDDHGGPVFLPVSHPGGLRFYRTGVKLPP